MPKRRKSRFEHNIPPQSGLEREYSRREDFHHQNGQNSVPEPAQRNSDCGARCTQHGDDLRPSVRKHQDLQARQQHRRTSSRSISRTLLSFFCGGCCNGARKSKQKKTKKLSPKSSKTADIHVPHCNKEKSGSSPKNMETKLAPINVQITKSATDCHAIDGGSLHSDIEAPSSELHEGQESQNREKLSGNSSPAVAELPDDEILACGEVQNPSQFITPIVDEVKETVSTLQPTEDNMMAKDLVTQNKIQDSSQLELSAGAESISPSVSSLELPAAAAAAQNPIQSFVTEEESISKQESALNCEEKIGKLEKHGKIDVEQVDKFPVISEISKLPPMSLLLQFQTLADNEVKRTELTPEPFEVNKLSEVLENNKLEDSSKCKLPTGGGLGLESISSNISSLKSLDAALTDCANNLIRQAFAGAECIIKQENEISHGEKIEKLDRNVKIDAEQVDEIPELSESSNLQNVLQQGPSDIVLKNVVLTSESFEVDKFSGVLENNKIQSSSKCELLTGGGLGLESISSNDSLLKSLDAALFACAKNLVRQALDGAKWIITQKSGISQGQQIGKPDNDVKIDVKQVDRVLEISESSNLQDLRQQGPIDIAVKNIVSTSELFKVDKMTEVSENENKFQNPSQLLFATSTESELESPNASPAKNLTEQYIPEEEFNRVKKLSEISCQGCVENTDKDDKFGCKQDDEMSQTKQGNGVSCEKHAEILNEDDKINAKQGDKITKNSNKCQYSTQTDLPRGASSPNLDSALEILDEVGYTAKHNHEIYLGNYIEITDEIMEEDEEIDFEQQMLNVIAGTESVIQELHSRDKFTTNQEDENDLDKAVEITDKNGVVDDKPVDELLKFLVNDQFEGSSESELTSSDGPGPVLSNFNSAEEEITIKQEIEPNLNENAGKMDKVGKIDAGQDDNLPEVLKVQKFHESSQLQISIFFALEPVSQNASSLQSIENPTWQNHLEEQCVRKQDGEMSHDEKVNGDEVFVKEEVRKITEISENREIQDFLPSEAPTIDFKTSVPVSTFESVKDDKISEDTERIEFQDPLQLLAAILPRAKSLIQKYLAEVEFEKMQESEINLQVIFEKMDKDIKVELVDELLEFLAIYQFEDSSEPELTSSGEPGPVHPNVSSDELLALTACAESMVQQLFAEEKRMRNPEIELNLGENAGEVAIVDIIDAEQVQEPTGNDFKTLVPVSTLESIKDDKMSEVSVTHQFPDSLDCLQFQVLMNPESVFRSDHALEMLVATHPAQSLIQKYFDQAEREAKHGKIINPVKHAEKIVGNTQVDAEQKKQKLKESEVTGYGKLKPPATHGRLKQLQPAKQSASVTKRNLTVSCDEKQNVEDIKVAPSRPSPYRNRKRKPRSRRRRKMQLQPD